MILSVQGKTPEIGEDVYVAPTAVLIGDVLVGRESSIWFGTVVRGDIHYIRIGEETNIQDNSTLHVTSGTFPLVVGHRVSVGHGAVIHGCTIEDDCLIGIGATVLDGAVVGKGSVIAASALVTPGMVIPPRSLVMGIPGKVVREIDDDTLNKTLLISQGYRMIKSLYMDDAAK